MKIFLDTSSLFKLYHDEEGTKDLELLFSKVKITEIYLSEITKVEFSSTIWKKVRTKEITIKQAEETLMLFALDFERYNFVPTDNLILNQAITLIQKHGKVGLRTLDGVQLSTCLSLKNQADAFFTADKLLHFLISEEGLKTEISF